MVEFNIYKVVGVADTFYSFGERVHNLPPFSPHLNPIERR